MKQTKDEEGNETPLWKKMEGRIGHEVSLFGRKVIMTKERVDELREVHEFYSNPENQEQIRRGLESAAELNRLMCEARRVTPEMLNTRITI